MPTDQSEQELLYTVILSSLSINVTLITLCVFIKLNPLRALWPMELALISGFCSVKRMRGFDSPWMGH